MAEQMDLRLWGRMPYTAEVEPAGVQVIPVRCAAARHGDPETAHAAARGARGSAIAEMVASHLREAGPRTTEEIAAEIGLSLVTVSPRLAPLARAGRVRDSGSRRRNASGRLAIVWEALP